MTLRKVVFQHHALLFAGKPQQTDLVCKRRLAHAEPTCGLFLRHRAVLHQSIDCSSFLKEVQVTALHIFNKRQHRAVLRRKLLHNGRDGFEPRHTRSTPAALPCHQNVAVAVSAHKNRLQNAVLTNAFCELQKLVLRKIQSRLCRIWHNLIR